LFAADGSGENNFICVKKRQEIPSLLDDAGEFVLSHGRRWNWLLLKPILYALLHNGTSEYNC